MRPPWCARPSPVPLLRYLRSSAAQGPLVNRIDADGDPLRCWSDGQLLEQCLGLDQVGGIETFGKPTNDRCQQAHRPRAVAPRAPNSGEVAGCAQRPQKGPLFSRRLKAVQAVMLRHAGVATRDPEA